MFFIKEMSTGDQSVRLIWLHGWGCDHTFLLPLASFFESHYENYCLDLPGFGRSQKPQAVWGTEEYAEALFRWINTLPPKPTYIIGHSFGGRVGIRLAHLYPQVVQGLILIAAAGLKCKRSVFFKIKAFILKKIGRLLTLLDRLFKTSFKKTFSNHVGSRDYKSAQGVMRNILVKTIQEDLASVALHIQHPVLLIYGECDLDTPPSFGERYAQLFKNAKFIQLPHFDHFTVLSDGRYQVQHLITEFLCEAHKR